MNKRRSVRVFEYRKRRYRKFILTASSAPSGAHKQPWTFCVVPIRVKSRIRGLAENEGKISYEGRMSDSWIRDLEPWDNLDERIYRCRPWVIIVMKKALWF